MLGPMLDRKRSSPPLLPRPCVSSVLWGYDRMARWLRDTYGGPLVTMSATTRYQLESLDMNANAPATVDSDRFALMGLLESIAGHNAMLRERGRTTFALPAEAQDVLLRYLWDEVTDQDVLRRAVEAAKALESKLCWRMLAMPLLYPNNDPFARGIIEKRNGW
jgi:hypothetical protein